MSNTEIDLLHALKEREAFEKYSHFVKEYTLTEIGARIFKDMGTYFDLDSKITTIEWSKFSTWFKTVKYPFKPKEYHEVYQKVFDILEDTDSTSILPEVILGYFETLNVTAKILDEANQIVDGKKDNLEEISKILEEYNSKPGLEEDAILDSSLECLLDTSHLMGGFEWRLEDMNVSIGPARKGDFIVVGGRMNSGKTSFVCNEVTHWATQMTEEDDLILWFNNEEEGSKILLRHYECALNKTVFDIVGDKEGAQDEYTRIMGGNRNRIQMWKDDVPLHYRDIERICREKKPKVIVFNVLEKVLGFDSKGNIEQKMKKQAQWARSLAKMYGPVFAVAQADGSAEGIQWITQNQLYYSKTGVPAEADYIITIGKSHDSSMSDLRFIHVPKNKMQFGPRCDPKYKEGKFEVKFNDETGRFTTTAFK